MKTKQYNTLGQATFQFVTLHLQPPFQKAAFTTNNMQTIAHPIVSSMVFPSVSGQRSQHLHDGTLEGRCTSTNDRTSILMTPKDSILYVQIKSLRAVVQCQGIAVYIIDIYNGFFMDLSRYNKIQYKTESKSIIFLSFHKKWCCRCNIGCNGT